MKNDLSSVAYRRLSEIISGPDWRDGGRLPPEESLSRSIGVSRPVLRRALALLREQGRIVSTRGSGNYVQPHQDDPSPQPARAGVRSIHELEQCLRFRMIVESGIASEAASRAVPDDIERLENANRRLAVSLPSGSLFEADFDFHLCLAHATGNPLFVQTLQSIQPQVRLAYEFGRQLRAVALYETSRRVTTEHENILDAIRSGDADAAQSAMHDHLGAGIRRLFGHRV